MPDRTLLAARHSRRDPGPGRAPVQVSAETLRRLVAPTPLSVAIDGLPPIVAAGIARLMADREVVRFVSHEHPRPNAALLDPAWVTTHHTDRLPADCAKVVVVPEADARQAQRARGLGAVALLGHGDRVEDFVATLEAVGGRRGSTRCRPLLREPDDLLTQREREVLAGVCHGLGNDEIARELYLSVNTVKTYIRSAYRRMRVSSRPDAVRWGIERGY